MKIAVVEDKQTHSDLLAGYIKRFEEEHGGTSFTVSVFSDGLNFLENYKSGYDVVFMDIQMPHIDGMETARRLRKIDSRVIIVFITELSQFAIRGYEVSALDYIVKPINYDKFRIKLERILSCVKEEDLGTVCIKNKDLVKIIEISKIRYIENDNHKIIYHTLTESIETAGSLDSALSKLPAHQFVKCSSSFVVNLHFVISVQGYEVTMEGVVLPLSRLRKKEFLKQLVEFSIN